MFGLPIKDIAAAVISVGVGIYVGVGKWKESRARKRAGVAKNPTSCKDHESRLRVIESMIGDIRGDIKAIKVQIGLPMD
jgi:hypothetical protein